MRSAFCLLALALLTSGCTVGRLYRGRPLQADPTALVEGQSTKSDVLRLFCPPDQITHQTDGDAFLYMYNRQNYSSFTLQEPVFTGLFLFNFSRQYDSRDQLIVLFDYAGVVRGVAADRRTEEMPVL